jgi:Zn-dependent protease
VELDFARLLQTITIAALPIVFAITLHEAAHGYVARMFGDPTAYQLGRVSLNPLRHIDPVGTILVPLLTLAIPGGMLFGWAKPVPVNFARLRRPKQDMFWVAAAGPASNLVMMLGWAALMRVAVTLSPGGYAEPMLAMGIAGLKINAVLMVLNLIPLPPLDGGRIAVSLLPRDLALPLARIEPYGMIILIALMFSQVLGKIINPFINAAMRAASALFGFS